MIKTKLGDLVVAQEGLQVLVDLSNEGKLAFTPGYGVARILKAAQPELEGFRAKQFELYKKYGEEVMIPDLDAEGKEVLDENGAVKLKGSGNWQAKPENQVQIKSDLEALIDTDVELVSVVKLKAKDLEGLNLSIKTISALEPLISE